MKHFFLKYILFSFFCVISVNSSFALEEAVVNENELSGASHVISRRYIPNTQVTELKLKNGLRVVIKQTDFDEGDVFVQFVAPGGYSSLSKEFYPSGVLASKIAMESGLGNLSLNEFCYSMYRDSIELSVNIEKTHRYIDASVPSENVENLLKIINSIFTENRLTESAMNSVIQKEKSSIRNQHLDKDQVFEVMHTALNTQNAKSLKPLSLKALNRVNLSYATNFYRECFTNPEDFVVVVVGDVDTDKIIPFIEKHLGSLENKSEIKAPSAPSIPSFPEGVTRRFVPTRVANDAYTRITIPLRKEFNENSMDVIQLMTLYMERELRTTMKKEIGRTNGIDVGFTLPLYPFQNHVWITISFYSPKGEIIKLEQKLIEKLKTLQKNGLTNVELEELKKHQQQSDAFWKHDNSYWQANLSNHYLWNWRLESDEEKQERYKTFTPELINPFMKESFSLENYTILSSQPG